MPMDNFKPLYNNPAPPPVGRQVFEARNISARLPIYMAQSYFRLKYEGVRPTDVVKASLQLMFRMLDEAAAGKAVPEEAAYLHKLRCTRSTEKRDLEREVEKRKLQLEHAEGKLKELSKR